MNTDDREALNSLLYGYVTIVLKSDQEEKFQSRRLAEIEKWITPRGKPYMHELVAMFRPQVVRV